MKLIKYEDYNKQTVYVSLRKIRNQEFLEIYSKNGRKITNHYTVRVPCNDTKTFIEDVKDHQLLRTPANDLKEILENRVDFMYDNKESFTEEDEISCSKTHIPKNQYSSSKAQSLTYMESLALYMLANPKEFENSELVIYPNDEVDEI